MDLIQICVNVDQVPLEAKVPPLLLKESPTKNKSELVTFLVSTSMSLNTLDASYKHNHSICPL